MRKDRLHRHLFITFALALVAYVGVFSCDQRVRHRKGPWQVRFLETTNGEPAIRITQPFLGITNVLVVFAGEQMTNGTGEVVFNKPQKPLPFGQVKFEDLTYLPGSVTMDFFGHEVELLPRTLYLNRQEKPWMPGTTFRLEPGDKLPPENLLDRREKKASRPAQAGTNSAPLEPAGTR